MKQSADARVAVRGWNETPYSEGANMPKLSRASVSKTYNGDIVGDSHVEYLMMIRSDGSAAFAGFERVVGQLAGRNGSFVLQRTGVLEDGLAKESCSVVPGSATGDLEGLVGEGTSVLPHGPEHPFTLNYEFAK